MSLSTSELHAAANELLEAEKNRRPVAPLIERYKNISVEDAYQVQMHNANQALMQGKRLVGYKIGLTSRAAQIHFGLTHPDLGHLFAPMAVADEGETALSQLIQPKIESEIALVLGKDLKGPDVTIVDVMNAVEYAVCAMEIIDSRIENWKITAADTIADNGSSAQFVLGENKVPVKGLNLAELGMAFYRNGEVLFTASGAAVMGNPLNALVFLANELGKHNRTLRAGEVILSGALSGMSPMKAGDFFSCEIAKLGSCSVRVS